MNVAALGPASFFGPDGVTPTVERVAPDVEVASIVAERDRVVGELRSQGWTVPEPQGNFVWLPLAERTPDLVALAEEAGITVRPFAGEGVRVSIGEPEGNDVFLQVASQLRPA